MKGKVDHPGGARDRLLPVSEGRLQADLLPTQAVVEGGGGGGRLCEHRHQGGGGHRGHLRGERFSGGNFPHRLQCTDLQGDSGGPAVWRGDGEHFFTQIGWFSSFQFSNILVMLSLLCEFNDFPRHSVMGTRMCKGWLPWGLHKVKVSIFKFQKSTKMYHVLNSESGDILSG